MSAQTRYGFSTPVNSAGGIADLAPYAIDTFLNEEETGKMKFGIGVVSGENKGHGIKVPGTSAAATEFEGITTNNRTTERDLEGNVFVRNGAAVGVMRYGRIYGRLASDAKPEYGKTVYMKGSEDDEAGYFTETEEGNIPINGRFLSGKDETDGIALIELFNAPNAVSP